MLINFGEHVWNFWCIIFQQNCTKKIVSILFFKIFVSLCSMKAYWMCLILKWIDVYRYLQLYYKLFFKLVFPNINSFLFLPTTLSKSNIFCYDIFQFGPFLGPFFVLIIMKLIKVYIFLSFLKSIVRLHKTFFFYYDRLWYFLFDPCLVRCAACVFFLTYFWKMFFFFYFK